jgi:hypothetical protein
MSTPGSRQMPLSPKTNAAIIRLQFTKSFEFNSVLKELLDKQEGLERVVEVVEENIQRGQYVVTEYLARLIAATERHSLFVKAREQLFSDIWALLVLYRSGYPDAAIEVQLCEALYQTASHDDRPERRYIVDAMEAIGSEAVLPILEAIRFELEPTVRPKQIFADSLKLPNDELRHDFASEIERKMPELEASSRKSFVEAISSTIAAVQARAATV